jgi:outer membrane protein
MKNKLAFFALLMIGLAHSSVQAQNEQKIGYTSINYILTQLPDAKRIESELKAYQAQLENSMQAKVKDFQEKAAAYEKGAATMADIIKADKEKELQNLQTSLQEFQRNAQADLQKKEASLVQPVVKKIYDVAAEVGKENGYAYILNSDESNPILVLAPKENDISELVLKKMGATASAKPTTTTPTTPTNKAATPTKKN